jgi:ATP-binding cassette subfamily B protein
VVVLPMLAMVFIVQVSWARVLRYDHARREATSAVTGFLGEVLTQCRRSKSPTPSPPSAGHLHGLSESRRKAEVKFTLFMALIRWAFNNITDLALGLVLLLAGQAMRDPVNPFTVGECALFVTYLTAIIEFPANLGSFLSDYQTQAVSIHAARTATGRTAKALVEHTTGSNQRGALPKSHASKSEARLTP